MRNLNMKRVLGAIIVVIVIGLLLWFGIKKWQTEKTSALNSSSYYAVFLNNNQVYFGHLSDVNDHYVSLTNIYYLQAPSSSQSTAGTTANASGNLTNTTDNSQLALIKLGNEVHGPKDLMKINRDTILFYEELNNNSKVVQAINKSK